MSSTIRRSIRSIPARSAKETWELIVDILTAKDDTETSLLKSITGIVSVLITERTFVDAPLIMSGGGGSRVRIYCLYDDNALEDDNSLEDKLTYNPFFGDWTISLPCQDDDLEWISSSLKKKTSKIVVRSKNSGIDLEENKTAAQELTVNLSGFLGT